MNIFGVFGAIGWDSHPSSILESGQYTSVHDSGATLFMNGKLVANILEERLTRFKNEGDFPYKSIEYCLSLGGITGKDVDIVYVPHLACDYYYEQESNGTLKTILEELFPNAEYKTISHHLCHAASTVFTSDLNEGSFFTLDGTGSTVKSISNMTLLIENNSIGYFNKEKKIFRFFPNIPNTNKFGTYHISLSSKIYLQKTGKDLIATPNAGGVSGKIMGLCAYGDKNLAKKDYYLNDYYDFPYIDFFFTYDSRVSSENNAASLQRNFESALLDLLTVLKERTYLDDNICFAGGCFLNVITNTLIKQSGLFKNIHIPPFTNDSGISFGAAAYAVFLHEKNYNIQVPQNLALMGKVYSHHEIKESIQDSGLEFSEYEDFDKVCEFTAKELSQNKIVGWFQNSSESGPRALGSRSLLMHPGPKENKDVMNLRVKHREYWRPFAGIILEEKIGEYFNEDFISPYMLYSFTAKKDKEEKMQAIIHEDKTCRAQTINKEQHYEIHNLLTKFNEISGLPVLLNTSFNDNGEPIVESPKDAINAFINLDIDYLVIGKFILSKEKNKKYIKKSLRYSYE